MPCINQAHVIWGHYLAHQPVLIFQLGLLTLSFHWHEYHGQFGSLLPGHDMPPCRSQSKHVCKYSEWWKILLESISILKANVSPIVFRCTKTRKRTVSGSRPSSGNMSAGKVLAIVPSMHGLCRHYDRSLINYDTCLLEHMS